MIYQGDNWPAKYRDTLFTINLHGRRLNNDILERQGSGYVGRHGADFLKSSDPWFRGMDLISGSDGGVYLSDWSDTGECHGADGVDRTSGRIFKVVYGQPATPNYADIAKLSDQQLVDLQCHRDDWYVRAARQRAAGAIRRRPADATSPRRTKRDLRPGFRPSAQVALVVVLVRHRGDDGRLAFVAVDASRRTFARLGHSPVGRRQAAFRSGGSRVWQVGSAQKSGLVLLYLASTLQQIPPADRWPLAEELAARGDFAADRVLPLMIWYGIESAVPEDPTRAVRIASSTSMFTVVQYISRRLTENIRLVPKPVDGLVQLAGDSRDAQRTQAILAGMAEALRGWHKAPMPGGWQPAAKAFESSADAKTRSLARELSVVFGDGRALGELMRIARSKSSDAAARHDAVRVLVDARGKDVVPLLCGLLGDRDLGADAARGLAAFDDPDLPGLLLDRYHALKPPAQEAAVVTLSSRPAWARLLLAAIRSGKIDRSQVPAFQVRQMSTFPGDDLHRDLVALWPELKTMSAAKQTRIDQLRILLTPQTLAAGDRVNGRRRFAQSCATCHTLFGQGGKIGPDLTGSQRSSLDYLLVNIVDPSALVAPAYRMSTVVLSDGRVLNGILNDQSGPTVTIQTPTERLVINRSDIEEIRKSELSLMPEGQLDVLPKNEVRDLIAYLMSPQQVPLPAGSVNGESRAAK